MAGRFDVQMFDMCGYCASTPKNSSFSEREQKETCNYMNIVIFIQT